MKAINVMDYSELRVFLKAFLKTMRSIDKKYSMRYFAKKLNWPPSLISDVINRRKSLSISKILEFSKLLNLTDIETERLIHMTIVDTPDEGVKKYFQNKLKTSEFLEFPPSLGSSSLYIQQEFLVVYDFLSMTKEFISYDDILEKLITFNLTKEKVENIVTKLVKDKFLSIDKDGSIIILKGSFHHDDKSIDSTENGMVIHKNYARNFLNFCDNPKRPFSINSAYIVVKKENYKDFLNNILELRNFLISKDQVENSDGHDYQLYQLDINFFPISK